MDTTPLDEQIPESGQWPVDPQEDIPISEDRIWVDGCFDFSHHGRLVTAWSESQKVWISNNPTNRSCRRYAAGASPGESPIRRNSFRRGNSGKQGAYSDVFGRKVCFILSPMTGHSSNNQIRV